MTSVLVKLVWFEQVLEIGSNNHHFSVVCVASIKYCLSLAMISILVQWSEVLTGKQEGNGKPQKVSQYPWGSVTPYLVSWGPSIAGEC